MKFLYQKNGHINNILCRFSQCAHFRSLSSGLSHISSFAWCSWVLELLRPL